MGLIKDKAMDFLNDGGFDLSYDEWTLPKLDDMDVYLKIMFMYGNIEE